MKFSSSLLLQCIFVTLMMTNFGTGAEETPTEKYSTKYDELDVDAIIKSPRLLKNYVECVIDKGHCTPDGVELKKNIPDALQTDCSKCSEKQKTLTDKMLHHLIDHEPDYWKLLQEKYDSSKLYTKKYFESKHT